MNDKLHNQSLHIVTNTLQQSIIKNAMSYCIPKQYVYDDSCRNIEYVQNCILGLNAYQPDNMPNNLCDVRDVKKCPTSFKVKEIVGKKVGKNKRQSSIRKHKPSILRQINGQYSNFQPDNIAQGSKKSLDSIQSYKRFQQSSSSHESHTINFRSKDRSKLVRLRTGDSDRQNNVEMIKLFRENLFIKPHYFYDFQKHQQDDTDSEISESAIKKIKQPTPTPNAPASNNKKFMALNTDYSGVWVQINKNDIKKQIPHYIQLQTQVIQQNKQLQPTKSPLRPQPQPKQQQQLSLANRLTSSSQYSNYKQLKFQENQNVFVANVLNKTKTKNIEKTMVDLESMQTAKNIDFYINSGKSIGKKFKPARVGFHVFQQMKNSSHWSKSQKGQQSLKKQQRLKTSGSHHDELNTNEKSSKQNMKDSKISKLSNKIMEKAPNVVVKSSAAMNYLLSQNTKPYKNKKVTIIQNCI